MKNLLVLLAIIPLASCAGAAFTGVAATGLAINHLNDPTPCHDASSCVDELAAGVNKAYN